MDLLQRTTSTVCFPSDGPVGIHGPLFSVVLKPEVHVDVHGATAARSHGDDH